MELFLTFRALFAFIVLLFSALWLARQLKIHREQLSVRAVFILAFIMVLEPGCLAFSVWAVHSKAAEISSLMIHAYTYLKVGAIIFLLFILPSVYFARRFYVEPSIMTLKALRFALILPIVFAGVMFIEAPKMLWGEKVVLLGNTGWWIFSSIAVINLAVIALTCMRPGSKNE